MTNPKFNLNLVSWLSKPTAYPHHPAKVDLVETHISWVFLAGDLVFKLKKPVRFNFLDFSDIARRERACREELRLNRRLAPDIYLDVVPITLMADRQFQLGGEGTAIDWLVQMRRLPTERSFEALLRRGALQPEQADRLMDVLARFYRGLPPVQLTPAQYGERCIAHVQGNRRELLEASHQLPGSVVKRIHSAQLRLLRIRPELFEARVVEGRIVEGHGDLRPEHICMTDPPVVFDCLEFNEDFRRLDMADELAFLAEECDALGGEWVAKRLLEKYRKLTNDQIPDVLWAFYKSYRASVRAKVAALRADQLDGDRRIASVSAAIKYLERALEYVRPWEQPLVLVVGGLSGTGKSTLAAAFADALGADLLRTDVVRKELFGDERNSAQFDEGVYRPESRQRVYRELVKRASRLQRARISVVLDGTYSTADSIREVRAMAVETGARFLAVECVCSSETASERIRRRAAIGADASEARPETYERQRQQREAWPEDLPQCQVNTEQSFDAQLALAINALAEVWKRS